MTLERMLALALMLAAAPPEPLSLAVELARPLVSKHRGSTKNVLRVAIKGHPRTRPGRAPVNLALVLDCSGSMAGEKLRRARQAARMVVERLGPQDILSLLAYDDDVRILVPATRVESPAPFLEALATLEARGSTALFAGVSHGIAEVRRFVDPARVDRVVLLSDGRANVGPSAASELARLGAAAAKEGIAVTTIGLGLGFHEDLMARLALLSDGNHGFAEGAPELVQIFDAELQDALSVAASDINIEVRAEPGVRITRALARPVEVYGSYARTDLVQLRAGKERFLLLEVEVPPGQGLARQKIASVRLRARNLTSGESMELTASATVRFVTDTQRAAAAENRNVMVSTVEASAVATNRAALDLRDQGKILEAQDLLQQNATYLERNADRYQSPRLRDYSKTNKDDAKGAGDDKLWKKTRKKMRSQQHKLQTQQSY